MCRILFNADINNALFSCYYSADGDKTYRITVLTILSNWILKTGISCLIVNIMLVFVVQRFYGYFTYGLLWSSKIGPIKHTFKAHVYIYNLWYYCRSLHFVFTILSLVNKDLYKPIFNTTFQPMKILIFKSIVPVIK